MAEVQVAEQSILFAMAALPPGFDLLAVLGALGSHPLLACLEDVLSLRRVEGSDVPVYACAEEDEL